MIPTQSSKEDLLKNTQPSSDFKNQFKQAKANLNYSGEDLSPDKNLGYTTTEGLNQQFSTQDGNNMSLNDRHEFQNNMAHSSVGKSNKKNSKLTSGQHYFLSDNESQ